MPAYVYVLFAVLAGYMVIGRGFAYIGVGGLYVGEIAVGLALLMLAASDKTVSVFRGFVGHRAGEVACLMLALSVVYFVRGRLAYGAEANRDMVILFYVVFAFFGYAVATDEALLDRFVKLLGVLFPLCFAYGLTYPFGDVVRGLSPVVNAGAEAYLFGHYTMNYAFVIGGIFYYLLVAEPGRWTRACIVVGIATLLALFSRAGYVAFLTLVLAVKFLRPRPRRRIAVVGYLLLVLAIIAVFGMTEVYLPAQNHFRLSLPNIAQRITSIFSHGYVVSPEMAGFERIAQGTKNARLTWSAQALEIMWKDKHAILWGKGIGFNLGEVIGFGAAIRYVHNSYVTLLVLLGTLGAGVVTAFHALVIGGGVRFLRRGAGMDERAKNLLAFFLVYDMAFLLVAAFGPLLESPFLAANLYFVSGICMALTRRSRRRVGLGELRGN
jgi:O-antigen ligase